MPLGTEVSLSPGHIVLDGQPAPPQKEAHQPPNTVWGLRMQAGSVCNVGVLWPNVGWIKMPLGAR